MGGGVPVLTESVREEIFSHAQSTAPQESCGVLITDQELRYVPVTNVSKLENHFIMDPAELKAIKFDIVAIVHSHSTSFEPTTADRISCWKTKLPWLVVRLLDKKETWIEPTPIDLPYLDREFVYGVIDAYSLVSDFYQRELHASLPPRSFWWARKDIFDIDAWKSFRFTPVKDELQRGDIHLLGIHSKQPNHIAVHLGDGEFMHHWNTRRSEQLKYQGYWAKSTITTIRSET